MELEWHRKTPLHHTLSTRSGRHIASVRWDRTFKGKGAWQVEVLGREDWGLFYSADEAKAAAVADLFQAAFEIVTFLNGGLPPPPGTILGMEE